ncbi:hypothetical protein QFZ34_001446 [Phyllobacterium ifriqiyense]|uniref:Major facilitator superfamily (MFS) profile domain-containing protein n=1 Tax=Phyllobacterium ifriqiyense TaxID=314238 RepID=A0ABU0S687_9HYPH|nr:hypothetical protein [Phyllobacterium ifriqiyense]
MRLTQRVRSFFSLRKHGTFPSLEHLPQFYLSQAVISFAAMFFLAGTGVGITSALQKGSRELLSFIVLFGAINSMGALGSGVGFHNSGLSGCAPRNSYPP